MSPDSSPADEKSTSTNFLHLKLYPISLKFEDVGYKVKVESKTYWCHGCENTFKNKQILTGISGAVFPGEILGMLGPSGSGKTTLLTALAGRLPKKPTGSITYNNLPFSGTIKRRIGLVTQDDVLYPHLTVFETLLYTALLRLPKTLTRGQKASHADRVLSELGLAGIRNQVVGGGPVRGVSGGERKRVSIGQEMVINPSLLLLDEPTSGLDSTTAFRILVMLKGLASGGRTIVTTIHQPSSRIFYMLDKLLLLSEGRPLYYGATSEALEYFGSVGFTAPVNVNPADHLLDLANGIGPGSNAESDQGDEDKRLVMETLFATYQKISAEFKAEIGNSVTTEDDIVCVRGVGGDEWCSTWWEQVKVVLERGVKERRFDAFNTLRVLQVISVAFLGGLLWWQTPTSRIQDRVSLISFFSVFWGFYPVYNAVFTFPQERKILIKERSSGMYHLTSYFVARTLGDLPLELVLPTAFVFILYWMSGLKPSPVPFIFSLLVVLYTVLVAQSLGVAIGALMITDVKKATTLASIVTLVFLIAGGYYVQHIPAFIVWLKYVSFSYYCFKLLLEVQYSDSGEEYRCGEVGVCRVWDHPSIRSVGLGRVWVDVCAMACMLVGYRLLAFVALRRQLRIRHI